MYKIPSTQKKKRNKPLSDLSTHYLSLCTRVAFQGPITNLHRRAIAFDGLLLVREATARRQSISPRKHIFPSEHFLTGEGDRFQERQVLFLSVLFSVVCQELTYAWILGLAFVGNSALKWHLITSLIVHSSVLGDWIVLKLHCHIHTRQEETWACRVPEFMRN